MPESDTTEGAEKLLQPGEIWVGQAKLETGYDHSYIIRLIKSEKNTVEGRPVPTPWGPRWAVNLQSLKTYQQQPHKGGPLGHKLIRKKKTQEGEAPKTNAAA